MHVLASIPSPTQSVWHLGPIPVRAYALCIVAGIILAVWLTARRWRAAGGTDDDVWDVAVWACVFGIIGGRLYHVVTDPELYFEKGEHPLNALKIWDGGLGIWGAIALGTLGAWIGCRRKGMRLAAFGDAAVPGVAFAQGIGRWGNWFNNELYGGRTSLPWKLEIHDVDVVTGKAAVDANGHAIVLGYFQPTFLYESIWDIALGFLLLYLTKRYAFGRGNMFALYVMIYTVGRFWIEALRHDHANHILGLRLNDWTAILVFAGALIWFLRHRGTPGDVIYTAARARSAGADNGGETDETNTGDGDTDDTNTGDGDTDDTSTVDGPVEARAADGEAP